MGEQKPEWSPVFEDVVIRGMLGIMPKGVFKSYEELEC